MKKQPALTTGIPEPEKVDAFISALDHPLVDVVRQLRAIILDTDPSIGEGIAWNAPVFFYTGEMEAFDPKEYRRYIVGMNLFQKDCVRIIFLRGAAVNDPSGFLEGDYKDGRRLVGFKSLEELNQKEGMLRDVITQLLNSMQ